MSTDMAADTPHFRFRFLPVLTVILLGLGLPYLAGELVDFARHYTHLIPPIADRIGWLYAHNTVQLVLALVAIAAMKWLAPADYGLRVPEDQSYAPQAILFGVGLGVLMTLVDYAPNLMAHTPPKLGFPVTTGAAAAWLGFEGVYAGPTEEILYRSLLVTFLAAKMPGKVHYGSHGMSGAGVVVAGLFAFIRNFQNYFDHPWWQVSAQIVLVFALGVLAAYWLEKSRSILAPILGRNASGATEVALVLLMVNFWR